MGPELEIEPEAIPLPEMVPATNVPDLVDPVTVTTALALAGAIAALVAFLLGRAWQRSGGTAASWLPSVACLFGLREGLLLGCWWLDLWPKWPPSQVRDTFLMLVLPAVLVTETACALAYRARWFCWLLRAVIAVGAGRVLLHGTSYLRDSTTGTPSWSTGQAMLILGGLAAGLLTVWFLLTLLEQRAPSRIIPMSLSIACAGAGVTVMLSGYLSGGLLGLPLAAALAGAALVFAPGPMVPTSWIGPGVVGLFALLIMGYVFGELKLVSAVVLFVAPLVNWALELPWVRTIGPWKRTLLGLILAAAPVAGVVLLAAE